MSEPMPGTRKLATNLWLGRNNAKGLIYYSITKWALYQTIFKYLPLYPQCSSTLPSSEKFLFQREEINTVSHD